MSNVFGHPSAEETQVANELAVSEEFTDDPVHCYQKLLTERGVEATGRIWSVACAIWDRNHGTEGGGEV